MNENKRTIETESVLEYKGAGELALTVEKVGEWELIEGEGYKLKSLTIQTEDEAEEGS